MGYILLKVRQNIASKIFRRPQHQYDLVARLVQPISNTLPDPVCRSMIDLVAIKKDIPIYHTDTFKIIFI